MGEQSQVAQAHCLCPVFCPTYQSTLLLLGSEPTQSHCAGFSRVFPVILITLQVLRMTRHLVVEHFLQGLHALRWERTCPGTQEIISVLTCPAQIGTWKIMWLDQKCQSFTAPHIPLGTSWCWASLDVKNETPEVCTIIWMVVCSRYSYRVISINEFIPGEDGGD